MNYSWLGRLVGDHASAFQGFKGTNKGANIIAAACPFCNTMLTDGVQNKQKEDEVAVLDIAELVAASMAAGS